MTGIGSTAFPYASEVLTDDLQGPIMSATTSLSQLWSALIGEPAGPEDCVERDGSTPVDLPPSLQASRSPT